ncbi:MAG: hypothetical protein ACK559_12265, partial [bacterium]
NTANKSASGQPIQTTSLCDPPAVEATSAKETSFKSCRLSISVHPPEYRGGYRGGFDLIIENVIKAAS